MSGSGITGIELNDVGVILAAKDEPAEASPGIAFWDGSRLRVGEEARRSQYVSPRSVNDSFWDRLSQDPLPRPLGFAVSSADLAHAHLESLWSPVASASQEVVIALTAGFDVERLGLLLGIAQSLSIPVVGVVDAAVVLAANEAVDAVIHVDLQRYRAVITRVECGETCVRGVHVRVDSHGWCSFMDRLATGAAESFVRRTRFDPLHRPGDEQALHNRLFAGLAGSRESGGILFEIAAAGRTGSVHVSTREFAQDLAPLAAPLVDRVRKLLRPGESTLCQLTARVGELPGLLEAFQSGLDCEVVSLAEGAAARRARSRLSDLQSLEPAVPYVTKLERNPGQRPRSATADGDPNAA